MTTLLHITLDLPVKLHIVTNVKVKSEVKKVTHTLVVHGVKTLKNDNRGRLHSFGSVKSSVHVVVDGLGDGLSLLQGLHLFVHEIKVVLGGVEGSETRNLTSLTVVEMVVIKADNSGKVGDKSVGLPSAVIEATPKRTDNITTEDGGKTAHEGGFSASRVSSNTNDDGGFTLLQGHVKVGRGGHGACLEPVSRDKGGRHEGRNRGGRKGSDAH
mmetsp:Transcript_9494/g.13236  ORF Transcript_9494/g.13236 Transcript_9494/m.13236 type:complete len:213 (-) Transcript_9494:64-702(-)